MGIHIGQLIRERLRQRGQSVTWFSKEINRSRPACYDIFKSDNIDTILLKQICEVLEYDFFKNYSDDLCSRLSV